MNQRYRKLRQIIAVIAIGAAPLCSSATCESSTYHAYFLGGQSNMDGYGYTSELPPDDRDAVPRVRIFHGETVADGDSGGGIGIWGDLAIGHGVGFRTDGSQNQLSDRFGPELSFGRTLSEQFPDRKIAIIKYSRGGTALVHGVSGYGSWDPEYADKNGRNQYDNALTTIALATDTGDIDEDGCPDRLLPAGIAWMQGEADAYDNLPAVTNYARNLKRLMDLLRASLRVDDLPVVIGRIRDSGDSAETRVMKYSPEVRKAQAEYVSEDSCAALVTATDDAEFLPDGWHYRSEAYTQLGIAFAQAVTRLEEEC